VIGNSSTGTGESGADPQATELVCSFCGKSQSQVRKLIAGPRVNICDECVELSSDLLEENEPAAVNERSSQATTFRHSVTCALCHLPQPIEELLPIAERGFLCAACLEAVRFAADEFEGR
jgi:hypothetical protein